MRYQNSNNKKLTLGALILVLMNFSSAGLAGDRENRMIDKAVEAYGGNQLTQLQSLDVQQKMNHYSQGQSGHSIRGQKVVYLSEYQIELAVDLKNKRKVFKQATQRLVGSHDNIAPTVTHQIFADDKGYRIDHALEQYQASKRVNYNNADMGHGQMLDPLIVRQLNDDRNASQWTDTAYIQGEAHDVLKVNADTKQEYTVYLNQQSGYLTRLLRKQGGQLRSYDFLKHHQTQGIVWAKQLLVSKEKHPVYHTISRQIRFNSVQDHQFKLPTGYKVRPKTQWVNSSQMTLRQLAKDVYFVGQNWGYTLFIDAGEYYISAGAWQMDSQGHAWQKGLTLLRQKTGNDKPVKQHIVSHHHDDHMMGLSDIVKQGANLIIHPADIPSVQKHLTTPLPDDRFIPLTTRSDLVDGKVMLFDVPNSHANHNIVIYLPEHKLLFTEDMFGSSFQTAFHSPANWPDVDTYNRLDVLLNKVKQLDLEVEQYVSSHHKRILNQTEIDEALTISRPSKETLFKRLFSHSD